MAFRPRVHVYGGCEPGEYYELGEPPPHLLAEFLKICSPIYPQEMLSTLCGDGYNPVIIGYDHDGLSGILSVMEKFSEIRRHSPQKLTVAFELVPPEQLGFIKEFLQDEKEFLEKGTIRGKKPDSETVKNLMAYRSKLARNHGELLALRLMEDGFDLVPLEHPRALFWIYEDRGNSFYEREARKREFGSWDSLCSGFTSVSRDLHGLEVLAEKRPDIISVGALHALKYEILLNRDGSSSSYFFRLMRNWMGWSALFDMWRKVHVLHREHPPHR